MRHPQRSNNNCDFLFKLKMVRILNSGNTVVRPNGVFGNFESLNGFQSQMNAKSFLPVGEIQCQNGDESKLNYSSGNSAKRPFLQFSFVASLCTDFRSQDVKWPKYYMIT